MSISIDLIGQTGNQMFQIATVMALALDNHDSWVIPEHATNGWKRILPLHYKLMPTIPYEAHQATPVTYREPHHPYAPIPYAPGMKLRGFFQSEKYFAHRRDEVTSLFRREWRPCPPLRNTVGVHVRRGDYLRYATKHPSPSVEWLQEAISHFSRTLRFMFFSDDIEWCKDNFPFHSYSEGRSTLEDMALLSSCEHQIISASSFGWWAAWMNENPHKKVVAPKVWFGSSPENLDDKDVAPAAWVKL